MAERERRAKGEGSLIRRKGCRFWYAQWYEGGRAVRESTKETVKQKALAVLRRKMGKSESGETAVSQLKKIKYGDLREALLSNYGEKGNKSLETRDDGTETTVGLKQLDEFCGFSETDPGVSALQLTTDFARRFVKHRQAEGAGPATINRSLACLRRMLRIAHEDGKLQSVPKIRMSKEPPARRGFLPLDQFQALIGALPSYLRPLVTFLYYCGVRLNEALSIDWSQVDLKHRTIRLEEEQTKSKEARVIPLPSALVMMLSEMDPKRGPVFDGTNLRREWERACAAVGLGTREQQTSANGWKWHKYAGLLVHDLRRSAVRNLRLAGVPENVAMKISGHKTRDVFDRYNIVSTEDVTEAMRRVDVANAKALPVSSARLVQKRRRTQVKPATGL